MARNRKDEVRDELNFDRNIDSYKEKVDPEVNLVNTILNDGEDAARGIYGDDKVDRALLRHNLSRSYNPRG